MASLAPLSQGNALANRLPTARGRPSGNRTHRGAPTASPSHPPRGHQATRQGKKQQGPRKGTGRSWATSKQSPSTGLHPASRRLSGKPWTMAGGCGISQDSLRGPRHPPERHRPTHGHPGAFSGKGGRRPPNYGRAHTHPPTRRGGNAREQREVHGPPSARSPPGPLAQCGNEANRTMPTESSPSLQAGAAIDTARNCRRITKTVWPGVRATKARLCQGGPLAGPSKDEEGGGQARG